MKLTVVRNKRELRQVKLIEPSDDRRGFKHPVSIEADAFSPDRRRQIKPTIDSNDTLQFLCGFLRAAGINRIAISAKSDVLNHMKAG